MEDMIVVLVMLFVLLPVRIIFVTYVSDNWLGSFGVISTLVFLLVYLSKKNKLGPFGRMFWKRLIKAHQGKRRIISYTVIGFTIYLWASFIAGINASDQYDIETATQNIIQKNTPEQNKVLANLDAAIASSDIQTTQQILSQEYSKIPIERWLVSIPLVILLPVLDFPVWSILTGITDELLNGYLLHFSTVFFVESLEIVGILIYTKWVTHRQKDK